MTSDVREVSALQAAYSAAAEAAAVELRAHSSGVDAPLSETAQQEVDESREAATTVHVNDVKMPHLTENEQPPNDRQQQRPTSLSPPRSSSMAFSRTKTHPDTGSKTPGPMSSSRRLVGLRAWADAAPESPWEAPPPIAADTSAKAKGTKEGKAAPFPTMKAAYDDVKDPMTELEELLERRGRRSARGRGGKGKSKGEVSPKGDTLDETRIEAVVNAVGSIGNSSALAMRCACSEDVAVPVVEENQRGVEEEKGSVGEDVMVTEGGHANGHVDGAPHDQRVAASEDMMSQRESGAGAEGSRSSGVVGVLGEEGDGVVGGGSGRRLTRRSSSSSVRLSQDGRDGRLPMLNKINSCEKNIHRSAR